MPRTVAVIGASRHRYKYGNRALHAYAAQGYTVVAINPHEQSIEGYPTFGSVLDVPGAVDIASVYLPPDEGLKIVDELAEKGVGEVWLNPGADGEAVVARARALGLTVIQACSLMALGSSRRG
jgi:uncharacterized protein